MKAISEAGRKIAHEILSLGKESIRAVLFQKLIIFFLISLKILPLSILNICMSRCEKIYACFASILNFVFVFFSRRRDINLHLSFPRDKKLQIYRSAFEKKNIQVYPCSKKKNNNILSFSFKSYLPKNLNISVRIRCLYNMYITHEGIFDLVPPLSRINQCHCDSVATGGATCNVNAVKRKAKTRGSHRRRVFAFRACYAVYAAKTARGREREIENTGWGGG